jgi:hypothetical protein
MSDKILKIFGRYIYDSRGNPTVEVDLWTSKGIKKNIEEEVHTPFFFLSFVLLKNLLFDKTRP